MSEVTGTAPPAPCYTYSGNEVLLEEGSGPWFTGTAPEAILEIHRPDHHLLGMGRMGAEIPTDRGVSGVCVSFSTDLGDVTSGPSRELGNITHSWLNP